MDKITYKADDLLTIFIDRNNPAATVDFVYDDDREGPTPFQTANMPMDDQRAAKKVSDWLDLNGQA